MVNGINNERKVIMKKKENRKNISYISELLLSICAGFNVTLVIIYLYMMLK
jgi:hypothetical protein